MTFTSGGQSMDWKKPFKHQRTVMAAMESSSATAMLHREVAARPRAMIRRGEKRSPRAPLNSWPTP